MAIRGTSFPFLERKHLPNPSHVLSRVKDRVVERQDERTEQQRVQHKKDRGQLEPKRHAGIVASSHQPKCHEQQIFEKTGCVVERVLGLGRLVLGVDEHEVVGDGEHERKD